MCDAPQPDLFSPGGNRAANSLTKYKVVFLGDQSVGKTSIITRFMYDSFDNSYQATIGIDFLSKTVYLDDGRVLRLQLWDTAGQERFRSLIPSYIRDSSLAVIVYSVIDRKTFTNALEWVEKVRDERGEDIIIALVGNKTDCDEERKVSYEEGELQANEIGAVFTEVSAKANINITAMFNNVAAALPQREVSDHIEVHSQALKGLNLRSSFTGSEEHQTGVVSLSQPYSRNDAGTSSCCT